MNSSNHQYGSWRVSKRPHDLELYSFSQSCRTLVGLGFEGKNLLGTMHKNFETENEQALENPDPFGRMVFRLGRIVRRNIMKDPVTLLIRNHDKNFFTEVP